tara:strand:- start:1451 stop:2488 length:1038 start_codon:yes stop_codon:yes gene_type:complete
MKGILITGGSGFIGSHLTLSLLKMGYKIFVIDSLINSSKKIIDKINKLHKSKDFTYKVEFFKVDIRDADEIKKVFKYSKHINFNIDLVIHLAGLKSIRDSYENPKLYWDVNVNGTKTLINEMINFNCKKIIFSSSASIYDASQKSPFTEQSLIKPSNPYGKTKLAAERILLNNKYFLNNYIDPIVLRYFNPIGSEPTGFLGEERIISKTLNNLFPNICNVAKGSSKSLYIYGKDWPTKDGTAIRDFIHISDLVNAHKAVLDYFNEKSKKNRIFNIGTGKGTSVLELINAFQKVNKLKLNYIFRERRGGDYGIIYADCNLAKEILNWQAKKNIEDMCLDGWNSIKR